MPDGSCGCKPPTVELPDGSCGCKPPKIKTADGYCVPKKDKNKPDGCPSRNRSFYVNVIQSGSETIKQYASDEYKATSGEFAW